MTARIDFARRMAKHDPSLRLYAILDAESCARRNLPLLEVAGAFRTAGVQLLQYRDKIAFPAVLRATAIALRELFPPGEAFLLLNDHSELAEECNFDGAHVGQTDTPIDVARAHLGPDRILGLSTHTPDQALAADSTEADYLAIGPVYATQTKPDAEPPVGLCGVQAAKAITRKPLVAIGGITAAQGRAVLHTGADSIALISALLPHEHNLHAVTQRARDILAALK